MDYLKNVSNFLRQGFGCLNFGDSDNLDAWLNEGGLFPANEQTIRIREIKDDHAPGAPPRNNLPPVTRTSQDITEMETVTFYNMLLLD